MRNSADKQSFTVYLDSDAPDTAEPTAPLALSRLLSSVFTIMGTHFTVLKQLHPGDTADFHLSCLDYITNKVGKYIQQERSNKSKDIKQRLAAKRGQAMTFWKCLVGLLAPVNGRDALKIRDQMEAWIEERTGATRLAIAMSKSRAYDGYKAYEKKLITIMGRDENVKMASQRVVRDQQAQAKGGNVKAGEKEKGKKRSREVIEEDEEEGEEGAGGRDRSESLTPTPDEPAPKTKALPKGKDLRRGASMMDIDEDDAAEDEGDAQQEEEGEEDLPEVPDMDVDLDLDLELENDIDFANADFPILTQRSREGSRARSVSVEPVQKKKRNTVIL